MGLIGHLEAHFGEIAEGWHESVSGEMPFQIARFADHPRPGASTLVTLGLGRRHLHACADGLPHQELILCASDEWSMEPVSLLLAVGERLLGSGIAAYEGQVFGPSGPIVDGSPMVAFCVATPPFLDRVPMVVHGESEPIQPRAIVPVSATEVRLVEERGVVALLEALARMQVDLLSLSRPSCV